MANITDKAPAKTKRLSGPALRTFFRIAAQWDVNREEQMALLGLTATSTFHKWKHDEDGRIGPDTLERISYIFGIYKALQILFPEANIADSWIKSQNSDIPFGGRTPLAYMVKGKMQNLWEVRHYLDAYRGT